MTIFAGKPPWYVAGLAFECLGCGRCCAGPEEGFVWITPGEVAAIADCLGVSADEVKRKYVRRAFGRMSLIEKPRSNDCIFLTAGEDGPKRCRIYPARPAQCRTWPFWPGNLDDQDDWTLAAGRCPGINRGSLYTCDEIDRKRKATRA